MINLLFPFLWPIRTFFMSLSSDISPSQLCAGFSFGILLGLMDFTAPITYTILILVLLLRVNLGMVMFSLALCKLLAPVVDNHLAHLGRRILSPDGPMGEIFTQAYNTPWIALSGYNIPTVMGGFVIGCILFLPAWGLCYLIVKEYRKRILPKLEKIWIIKVIKGSIFYRFYSWVMRVKL